MIRGFINTPERFEITTSQRKNGCLMEQPLCTVVRPNWELHLNTIFSQEKDFSYKGLSMDEIIHHLAVFVSRLWQIHIFGEGNTRTTAVFFIKYLRSLGFSATNDIFAENAWYFRNALVRANYTNLQKGIHETTEYLEAFLRNLLLNEKNEIHNRNLHISGYWKCTFRKGQWFLSKNDSSYP